MKVTIVHEGRSGKTKKSVDFTGTNAKEAALDYIFYQQPIKIIAIRIE